MEFLDKYVPHILGIARIVIGLQFLEHGTQKVLSFPPAAGAAAHAVNIFSFPLGASGIIELVGGALITLGLYSRWAAFICSGEMAVAYFMVHFPHSPFPILNGGDLAATWCFVFLYFAAAGPGSFAINKK